MKAGRWEPRSQGDEGGGLRDSVHGGAKWRLREGPKLRLAAPHQPKERDIGAASVGEDGDEPQGPNRDLAGARELRG